MFPCLYTFSFLILIPLPISFAVIWSVHVKVVLVTFFCNLGGADRVGSLMTTVILLTMF